MSDDGYEPRQVGTLGGFIDAASELDPGLSIFARQPWAWRSVAIATRAPATLGDSWRERLADVFGAAPVSAGDDVTFFFTVGELQAAIRRLRRAGIKDDVRVFAALVVLARDRQQAPR